MRRLGRATGRRLFTGLAVALCLASCTSAQQPAAHSPSPQLASSTGKPNSSPTTSRSSAPRTAASASAATTARSTGTEPPPPTTPVAAPSKGNIHQVVATARATTLSSAALTDEVSPDHGVVISVTNIRAMSTEAHFPGEIAGPGIAVTIAVVNSSAKSIDLDDAIVDVRGSDGRRAIQVSGGPSAPMSGTLRPGDHASGVYVFTIPRDQRHPISIRFSYAAKTPTVLFVGDTH